MPLTTANGEGFCGARILHPIQRHIDKSFGRATRKERMKLAMVDAVITTRTALKEVYPDKVNVCQPVWWLYLFFRNPPFFDGNAFQTLNITYLRTQTAIIINFIIIIINNNINDNNY